VGTVGEIVARVVVFIGIDGTGKSNLIELVKQIEPLVEVRRVRAAVNPFLLSVGESTHILQTEIWSWTNESSEDKIILYDRLPLPDEFVYGNQMSQEDLAFYDHLCELAGVKFVYCQPADAKDYRRAKAQEPDEFFATHTPLMYDLIMERYDYFLHHTKCPVLRMNHYEDPSLWYTEEDAAAVLKFIREN
jgi:hypothetical protein